MMKTSIFPTISILSIFLFFLLGCNDDQECAGVACTADYRIVTIEVKDQNGDPVLLDAYNVLIVNTNERLTFDPEVPTGGQYTLVEDQHMSLISSDGTLLLFEGLINDEVIASEEFVVGHDCCHVIKVSGPDEVVINL